MRPYGIRQFRDGAIDYNASYAKPVSLPTTNMFRFCRQAASLKTILLVTATVAALVYTASISTHRTTGAQCKPATVYVPVSS